MDECFTDALLHWTSIDPTLATSHVLTYKAKFTTIIVYSLHTHIVVCLAMRYTIAAHVQPQRKLDILLTKVPNLLPSISYTLDAQRVRSKCHWILGKSKLTADLRMNSFAWKWFFASCNTSQNAANKWQITNKHETLRQCWLKVGPASQTLDQG